ncbi:hypothetical protein [Sphingobacterium bovistauri]|uniref:Uncharacterized protein n=1 Tax=Sphingobacterium bovistauri TaxID=2781959 RepID=A0ABS7Z4S6_9SPHI|nr:hypothetical protein [Sphingobacterium bovistauri]MCA5004562.1 hypothetical protein [Sphingobacterium bovistauri]
MTTSVYKTIIFLISITLFSCRKSETKLETATIEIKLNGVNNTIEKLGTTKITKQERFSNYVSAENFDILTIISADEPNNEKINYSKRFAAVSKLPPNIKYRVLIYKVQGETELFVNKLDLISNVSTGETVTIDIVRGITYKWYTYSYNNTADLPNISENDLNNPIVPMGENKDFLYDQGEFTLTESGHHVINITFERKTSQIELDFDARGIFTDEIEDLNIELPATLLKTANFNLKENNISGALTNTSTITLTNENFYNIEESFTDRKGAALHTVATGTISNPTFTLKSLKIKLDDGLSRTYPETAISFSQNSQLAVGARAKAKVYLIESALTYAGVQWARANLYRKESGRNPYRFYHNNKQTNDPISYFSFRGHIPRKFASSEPSEQKDPCALIFPAYRWMQPSASNIGISQSKLSHEGGALTNILSTITDGVISDPTQGAISPNASLYIEYTPNPVSSDIYPITSRTLRFYFNGLHADIAVLEGLDNNGLVTLQLGNYGRAATFWTNEQGTNLLGLVQIGAWGYLGMRKTSILSFNPPSIVGTFAKGMSTANILNIGLLGSLNVIRSPLLNVRCVRNPDWTTLINNPSYNPVANYQ